MCWCIQWAWGIELARDCNAGPLSLCFVLSVPHVVSIRVTVVDGEGVEHLEVAMPLLRFHNGVRSHLPEVNVAPCTPQRPRGELLHAVTALSVMEPEQVSVQEVMFFLGDAHSNTHRRNGGEGRNASEPLPRGCARKPPLLLRPASWRGVKNPSAGS